jgi:hypothetical protein
MVVGNCSRSATYPQPFSTYFHTPEMQPNFDKNPVPSAHPAQAEASQTFFIPSIIPPNQRLKRPKQKCRTIQCR